MAFAAHKSALTLAIIFALTGCGGGGSEDRSLTPSDEPPLPQDEAEVPEPERLFSNGDLSVEPTLGSAIPVGVYRYTVTTGSGGSGGGSGSIEGLGIISASGRIALALEDSLEFARIELNDMDRFEERMESTFTGQDTIVRTIRGRRDVAVEAGSLERVSGTVVEQESGLLLFNYRLDRQASDELTLTPTSAAATYAGIGADGVSTAFSLGADGTMMGSDSTGCDFNGNYIVPDATRDVIELSFAAENCGPASELPPEKRDGDYFAVGRIDLSAGALTIFGTNGEVAIRVSGTDTDPTDGEVVSEDATFFSEDFDIEPSVSASLEPGVYDFQEIPLRSGQSFIEAGILIISDTGRIALATDSRLAVTRIKVSDIDTFRADITQSTTPGTTQPPDNAAEIFGISDNQGGASNFNITGSLLGADGDLQARYGAERDTANDANFTMFGLDIPSLSGTYTGTRNPGSITTTLTINSEGSVTGSDTTGCIFNGIAQVTSESVGVFEIQAKVANCSATTVASGAQRNGEYVGVGDYRPGAPDQLRVIFGSEDNVEFVSLDRQ